MKYLSAHSQLEVIMTQDWSRRFSEKSIQPGYDVLSPNENSVSLQFSCKIWYYSHINWNIDGRKSKFDLSRFCMNK